MFDALLIFRPLIIMQQTQLILKKCLNVLLTESISGQASAALIVIAAAVSKVHYWKVFVSVSVSWKSWKD